MNMVHTLTHTHTQALVGYFDIGFNVEHYCVHFSTSPQDPPTHWKQTVFYFKESIPVHTGQWSPGSHSACLRNPAEQQWDTIHARHRCPTYAIASVTES